MFLLEEDESLKNRLKGLTVSDDRRTSRPVEVWFGQPDLELKQRTYPYISIELTDITEDTRRVQVGTPELSYTPDGVTLPEDRGLVHMDRWPSPYNLDYTVSVWSRHPRHDREIVSRLLHSKLPIRGGQLGLVVTGRKVWMDMLGGPQIADTTDEAGKRLFRKVFSIRIATELILDDAIKVAGGRVSGVHIVAPGVSTSDFTPITATVTA